MTASKKSEYSVAKLTSEWSKTRRLLVKRESTNSFFSTNSSNATVQNKTPITSLQTPNVDGVPVNRPRTTTNVDSALTIPYKKRGVKPMSPLGIPSSRSNKSISSTVQASQRPSTTSLIGDATSPASALNETIENLQTLTLEKTSTTTKPSNSSLLQKILASYGKGSTNEKKVRVWK